MLTPEQEAWIKHLRPGKKVEIVPYNPRIKIAFNSLEHRLKSILGKSTIVQHRGASSMGISGKGDLDVYIPVDQRLFDTTVEQMSRYFGKPGSLYPLQRARWNSEADGFETEIFVVNNQHQSWLETVTFENFLNAHPSELERYRLIKESAAGLDTQEYYRLKTEFINEILEMANQH